jgi:hypothetical protein
MGGRESTIAGSTLLAICFLAGGAVRAMEPAQSSMSAASVQALPSFLSDERVPALQEAWQASAEASQKARSQQGEAIQFSAPVADDPMHAPRAATERAKQPGRDDASVRRRAEELSRRFGAGSATSGRAAKKAPPSSVATAPVVPAKQSSEAPRSDAQQQVAATPETPVRKKIVAETKMVVTTGALSPAQEVQPLDASVRTQSAMTTEKLRLAAPPPPSDATPPLPKRAPKIHEAAATAPPTTAAIGHTRPARSYAGPREPADPMAALRGTVLTKELRSFGWNSQPK